MSQSSSISTSMCTISIEESEQSPLPQENDDLQLQTTKFYDENLILSLNERRNNYLVSGYLRNYNFKHIGSYSIPVNIISNYYSNKNTVYPGLYLTKEQYFNNSVHIDDSIHNNQKDRDLYPKNIALLNNKLYLYKYKMYSSIIISLITTISLIIFWIITKLNNSHNILYPSIATLIDILICGLAVSSTYSFYLQDNKTYKLLKFNKNQNMIQQWNIRGIKINSDLYACQLVNIQDICRFNELKEINFIYNTEKKHGDIAGYIEFTKRDGFIEYISVSTKCGWIEILSSIKNVMILIDDKWLNKVKTVV